MNVGSGEAFIRGQMVVHALKTARQLRKRLLRHNVDTYQIFVLEAGLNVLREMFSNDTLHIPMEQKIKEFDEGMSRLLLELSQMTIDLIKIIERQNVGPLIVPQ